VGFKCAAKLKVILDAAFLAVHNFVEFEKLWIFLPTNMSRDMQLKLLHNEGQTATGFVKTLQLQSVKSMFELQKHKL